MPRHEPPEEQARKRAEFERQRAEDDRRIEYQRRWMFSIFDMWTVCPDKRCARARRCAGDVKKCLYERWIPIAPPNLKALLAKFIQFYQEGLEPMAALEAAEEDMRQRQEAAARFAAESAQLAPPPAVERAVPKAAAPVSPAPHGPRIRVL